MATKTVEVLNVVPIFAEGDFVSVNDDPSEEIGQITKLIGNVMHIRWPHCTEIVNLESRVWQEWLLSLRVVKGGVN